jgi:ferredoxin-NADP reductase
MLDVFLRALRHPFDYFSVLFRKTLILKEIIQESDTIYSFVFSMEKPFSWKAGQHGIFYFPKTKVVGKWWRAFSVASVPSEGVMRIATVIKEDPSDFKRNLLLLRPGDKLNMHGPFGEFHTNPATKHIVGIAGGIGITPFRALIKSIADGIDKQTKLTLIYSAATAHTFKTEFDALLPHSQIEIVYAKTPDEVTSHLDVLIKAYKNGATYFLSGAPGMIEALRKKLKENGIKKIVNDSFKGY